MIIFKWIKNKEIQSQNNNTILCFMVSLKGKFSQKWQFCHHLLTLMLFQTCMAFFLTWNSEKYFSINVNWDSTSSKNVEKNNIKVPE